MTLISERVLYWKDEDEDMVWQGEILHKKKRGIAIRDRWGGGANFTGISAQPLGTDGKQAGGTELGRGKNKQTFKTTSWNKKSRKARALLEPRRDYSLKRPRAGYQTHWTPEKNTRPGETKTASSESLAKRGKNQFHRTRLLPWRLFAGEKKRLNRTGER